MTSHTAPVETFDYLVFGGTGDLALRKLLPSLYLRDKAGQITATSRIIGVSRSQLSPADYKAKAEQALRRHLHKDEFDEKTWERFGARIDYVAADATSTNGWGELQERLGGRDEVVRAFYLATSPELFGPICERLGAAAWSPPKSRVVIEKPIGHDLASAHADQRRGRQGLRRGADLPHRPLPRQRDGAEPAGAALRQCAVRAAVERRPYRPRPDHRRRDPRRRGARRLLRQFRRAARHGAEPHDAAALPGRAWSRRLDMDADAVRDEKLKVLRSLKPIDDGERRQRHRARPVPGRRHRRRRRARLSRRARGPRSSTHRNLRRAQGRDRELALGRRAVLPAHRQAAAGRASRRSSSSSAPMPHSIFDSAPARSSPTGWSSACSRTKASSLCLMIKDPGPGGMRLRDVPLDLSFAETFKARCPDAYERLLHRRHARQPDPVHAPRRGRGGLALDRPDRSTPGRARARRRSPIPPAPGGRPPPWP